MTLSTMLTGAAGRALRTLEPLETIARGDRQAARALINGARDDIASALGTTRVSSFSAELHAAARNVGSGHGGTAQIAAGLDELAAAATRTATTRVAIGALAVGAGIGGIALLTQRGGDDGMILAPGAPGGEPPADVAEV